jgi:hypothetical protein
MKELSEAGKGILPVSLLRAETPRRYHKDAIRRHAPSRDQAQTSAHPLIDAGRVCRIEAKLHRSRCFVHLLPARTTRADENFFDLAVVDDDMWGNSDHLRLR